MGNAKIVLAGAWGSRSSTHTSFSPKVMRRNCDRLTPRSTQVLPILPRIKPSGGYQGGRSVGRTRMEMSRPSASKSKNASSRELILLLASFCAMSVRKCAVFIFPAPAPKPTQRRFDTDLCQRSVRYRSLKQRGRVSRVLCRASRQGPAPLIAAILVTSPQVSHVEEDTRCGTSNVGRVDFSTRRGSKAPRRSPLTACGVDG